MTERPPATAWSAVDKKRARKRVAHLIAKGRIPPANAVPCADCGHVWSEGERRHEHDHHLGYDPQHFTSVEVVCITCHRKREPRRGPYGRTKATHHRRSASAAAPQKQGDDLHLRGAGKTQACAAVRAGGTCARSGRDGAARGRGGAGQ